jgi:hypothetical protein
MGTTWECGFGRAGSALGRSTGRPSSGPMMQLLAPGSSRSVAPFFRVPPEEVGASAAGVMPGR